MQRGQRQESDDCCPGGVCELSGATCDEQSPPVLLGYVGEPVEAGGDAPPGTMTSAVVDDPPPFRRWNETLVHIADCEIAPVQTYGISATCNNCAGLFTPPLIIGTITKPQGKQWGDVVGGFDGASWFAPNNLVGVDDVVALLNFLTLKPGAPHITVVDLAGPGPTFLDFDVTATDLLLILQAFGGAPYPPPPFLAEGYPDLQAGASLVNCTGN